MNFDWYQATVKAHPTHILHTLQDDAGDIVSEVERGRGRSNYRHSTTMRDEAGNRVVEILHGGANPDPSVVASGAYAPPFADAVRKHFPDHNVSRVDVCDDLLGEGVFDHCEGVLRSVAGRHRVKGCSIVPDNPSDGATYMLGSTSSSVRLRLYDKAAEMRAKLPRVDHPTIPDHLTRVELQFRPKKSQKHVAAYKSPEDMWGCAAWTKDAAQRLLDLDVDRYPSHQTWKPDPDRQMKWFVQTYSRLLDAQIERLGSWEAFCTRMDEIRRGVP